MKTRIIGLGNTILTDDGVGIYVARAIAKRQAEATQSGRRGIEGFEAGPLDVVESEIGGLVLLELMNGWDRVVLVDAVKLEGLEPGTVVRLEVAAARTSLRLACSHEVDLPTALAVGSQLGYSMPEEVLVFAVQGEDLATFGEHLSPSLEQALPRVIDEIVAAIAPRR